MTHVLQVGEYGISNPNLSTVASTHRIIPEPYSVPQAYYPMSGEFYSHWPGVNSLNEWCRMWISDYQTTMGMHWYDSFEMYMNTYQGCGATVRCMKDADFAVKTGSVTNVRGTVAEVSGSVTVNDATQLEAVGFIFRELHPYMNELRVNGDSVNHADVNVSNGDYIATLTGLKPNMEYEIRAYAKGGYNVRYGDIIYFTTTSSGSSEDLGNGGDYEWE